MSYATIANEVDQPSGSGPSRRDQWAWTAWLVALGCLGLAVGVLVYLTDREASRAVLVPTFEWLAGSHLFGAIGQSLPSFAHTFAFSLFTAAALPPCSRAAYPACVAWCAVNIAFEVGQHERFSAHLAEMLQGSLGALPMSRPLANYFLRGTFDVGDIVAAVAGALLAAAVLRLLQRTWEGHHAQ